MAQPTESTALPPQDQQTIDYEEAMEEAMDGPQTCPRCDKDLSRGGHLGHWTSKGEMKWCEPESLDAWDKHQSERLSQLDEISHKMFMKPRYACCHHCGRHEWNQHHDPCGPCARLTNEKTMPCPWEGCGYQIPLSEVQKHTVEHNKAACGLTGEYENTIWE